MFWQDYSVQTEEVSGHEASVDSIIVYDQRGRKILEAEANESPLNVSFHVDNPGMYLIEVYFYLYSAGNDEGVLDGPGLLVWGFVYIPMESEDEYSLFAGVAPNVKLVGVKVLDRQGYGTTTDILEGIEWTIEHKEGYHIVAATITFGSLYVDPATELAVSNMIKNGIVTVLPAGNDGPTENMIISPGRLDLGITVAASNTGYRGSLNITNWSSRGPYGRYSSAVIAEGNTTKPDIAAPGGDFNEPALICVDTNTNDDVDIYIYNLMTGTIGENRSIGINEFIKDDFVIERGTSMATAHAGGAVALIIEALTGGYWSKWNYTLEEILKVKQIMLLTAWEIYSARGHTQKDRGEKDTAEGYGLLQVDAAIDAIEKEYIIGGEISSSLTSSVFGTHVWARKVFLEENKKYLFRLKVPETADFDLYLWAPDPDEWGQPILIEKGASSEVGKDEFFVVEPDVTGYYYITIKAIKGSGEFSFKVIELTEEEILSISIKPTKGTILETSQFNITVNITVKYSYVNRVEVKVGKETYDLLKIKESDDGRTSLWIKQIKTGIFDVKVEIHIITPIQTFTYEVSWRVIPYFRVIIASIVGVIIAVSAFIGYKIIQKRKLMRLMRIEEEAKKLAEEILEEVEEISEE